MGRARAGPAARVPPRVPVPLHVHLDAPLPESVGADGATAVFVPGWCVSPAGAIASLSVVVDGVPQPADAHGMPRLDVLRALHPRLDPYALEGVERDEASADDPWLEGYRSGFWATVALEARASGAFALDLRAELQDGQVAIAPLGTIAVEPAPEPVQLPAGVATGPEPLVAVCMATYEPREALLRRQVDSLRAQTHARWVCVISDDCSSDEGVATIARVVGDDPRFVLSRSPKRLGFYRNFERALALAPREAPLLALADQDDAWYPEKLAVLAGALGDAQLVYSDARVVREDGTELAPTYWSARQNNHADLLSLLVANAVTGAASLLRRELLDDALPFPPAQFAHFHDHWLALVALARGEIAYVDRPLYDYVQHGEASLGHAAANRLTSLRARVAGLRSGGLHARVALWRMHFFVDVARLTQVATVLRLRVGDRMAPSKRRALDRFTGADSSSVALASLWARGARELVRSRPETLGAEWMLAHAFTWRRALGATARPRPQQRLRLDAVPPPDLAPKPGRHEPEGPARAIADKVAPLTLAVRDDAPARVNLLLPSIDLQHLFGGYIAKFNLARRLAEHGARVRLVTVDPQPPLAPSWRAQLESFAGLEGLLDRVEVAFGREAAGGLEVSRDDTFIATTWWSAHIADAAVRALGSRAPFLYLVQEYEPFTFPMGTYAALADESYRLPHRALFSTELLREYFRRHGLGVYRAGVDAGDAASASFQNAITAVPPPAAAELAARSSRRLLFYARPEPHAARNMFELGVLALSRAAATGALRGWELCGIGSLGGARRIDLGGGAGLDLLPRSGQGEYARTLRGFDVGLALMYTPHPSLVPIEMASAGMLTVTTTFEHKDAAALAAISPNLLGVEAGIGTVADGIVAAAGAVDDVERRAAGSHVAWSQSWDASLDDALVGWILAQLRR